jgi:hypothetical protein
MYIPSSIFDILIVQIMVKCTSLIMMQLGVPSAVFYDASPSPLANPHCTIRECGIPSLALLTAAIVLTGECVCLVSHNVAHLSWTEVPWLVACHHL